jgi:D-alanyl-D-alanine carboxypeptidase
MSEATIAAAGAALTAYAEAMSGQTPVPGGSWAVVDRDGVIASDCWGLADLAAGAPVEPGHRFEIGSISKVVTAIVIHQLVDEGLVDLDRPVTDDLPWVDLGTPQAVITPRHLLSHTAGLVLGADHVPDEPAQVWGIRNLARSGEPGERFHYSNLGFMVLGTLAQHVTGQSWDELVESRVLRRIGAGTASGDVRHADRASMATGHWPLHDDRPFVPGDPITTATWFEVASADGNVIATAGELACLARFLLGDGTLDGDRLLTEPSMQALVSYSAPSGDGVPVWGESPESDEARYGLGINVERVGGHHCVTHGGGMVGYACYLLSDRDAGLGLVVVTNGTGDHPASHAIAYVGHRLFQAAVAGGSLPPVPDPSAAVRVSELDPSLPGAFRGESYDGVELSVEVVARPDGGVDLVSGGSRGRLFRTWSPRFATDHPELHRFPLTAVDGTWHTGSWVLRPAGLETAGLETAGLETGGVETAGASASPVPGGPTTGAPALDPALAPLVGHYRSWSPWFTTFRIVARDGGLVLVAAGGVEAPLDDMDLVEVADGVFRIGADPWLPERLTAGPVVEGRCVYVVRDGCTYSRTFTP